MRTFWEKQKKHGRVKFAGWPLYIDVDEKTKKHPTLEKFTEETGIEVDYSEVIQDTPSFFGKIQPQLAAGQYIGYDMMVFTNGIQLTQLLQLGYLVELDHARLPNFAKNAADKYKNPSYDPGAKHGVPWASGMTGIAYNPKYVDGITKIADLWNPKYKGKVGMMGDTQEVGNFGMMLDGVNPEKSTPADWTKAAQRLTRQRDAGIVRKYYENDYIKPLTNGDLWLTMAWSGDIFQQNVSEGTNLKFVVPEEGATLWTDSMMIPKGARNPLDALLLMDYYYKPVPAARLAEYINYITPVPAAAGAIRSDARRKSGADRAELLELVDSPLVFPTADDYAKTHNYRVLDNDELKVYQAAFQPIVAG